MLSPNEKDQEKNQENETIKELAERHLHDKNHHTTDDEIKNAQVEFTPVADSELSEINDILKEE